MDRALRFVFALLVGLALITLGASVVVQRTAREWFEKDVRLRAQLAVNGARHGLLARWSPERALELRALLEELTADERIRAAAAFGPECELRARTPEFPEALSGERLRPHLLANAESTAAAPREWHAVEDLPGGRVHVSALPLSGEAAVLGSIVLVQDFGFVERREAEALRFLLYAFAFLALAASAVTVIAARVSWRGWSNELRRILRGGQSRPEFQPILGDVRELVERISAEGAAESEGGAWTPARLKQTLQRHLHGEKVVIVANREPYVHQRRADGTIEVMHPASGLVTALEPVMRACSGTWIAHGSGSADRETVDARARVRVPPGEEAYSLRRVWLDADEERGYYYGFSNEGLWPLCHIAHTRPMFRTEDWRHYCEVNRKFADAACAEVDTDDPIVLVQDYHFALAPRLIRERLPRATIIAFWHIPWPNAQRFAICPWRRELLEGLLGASIVGFHTQADCNHFVESVERFLETRTDPELNAIVRNGRSTLVRPYPISLEWPARWLADAPSVRECRASVVRELELAPDALIGIGVDRLDYTKGIEERLLAVERALELHPELRGRFTFVQLAAPSRSIIEAYRRLDERVVELAERINQRFGAGRYRPIVVRRAHHEPPAVFRFYRAADVCYVSSLHDGMNLVAKEFVAAREDELGVLVLSQFTGAARELTEALIVNPYDVDEAGAALAAALTMSREEQRDRMRAMRAFVAEFNVYRWAGRMLVDASRLRSRDRLAGRLTNYLVSAARMER